MAFTDGRQRIRRFGRTIPVVLCAFTLFVGGALGETRSRSSTPAGTGSQSLLDQWRFHPSYASEFEVVRTSQAWSQSLNLARRIGSAIDLQNSWTVSNRRDTAQNDLRQKRGKMTFRLDYELKKLGQWTVGLDGNFTRDSRLSSFRDAVENRANLGLAMSSKLFQNWMRELRPLKEFNLSTSASLGFNRENLSNRQSTLQDTTLVDGLFRGIDVALNRKTTKIKFDAKVSSSQRSGDSETSRYSADSELLNRIQDRSENSRTLWDGKLQWIPTETFESTASNRRISELNRYYDTQANDRQGGQETKDGLNRETRFQSEWTPSDSLELMADFKLLNLDTDFELQKRDSKKQTKDGSLNLKVILPSLTGKLAGTELEALYDGEETSSRQEQTTHYEQRKRKLRFSLRRGMGRKLIVTATEEISLQQYIYVDRSNDRDERRLFLDGALNYRPSMAFNGIFSVTWNEFEQISIPAKKSANSSTRQTYKVSGDLTYQRGLLTVGQRYTVQADYTFFDFNEDNNTLLRTNSVMTTARTRILPHTMLSLKHQYEHKDKGSYVRDSLEDPRSYAPTSEENRHVLTLGAVYTIQTATSNPRKGSMTVDARQLFDRRQRGAIGSIHTVTTDRSELSIRANFEKEISDDFKIRMDFTKTESSLEKNYWRGSARIERRF